MNSPQARPATGSITRNTRIDVVCFTGNSGLTDYSVSLCRALAAHAEVCFWTAESLPERFRGMGFRVRTAFRRSRHYPVDFTRFALRVLRERPDVLLFQSPLKFPLLEGLVAGLWRLAGVKLAITVHDVLPHYPRWWSRAEYAWFYRRFDRVIVHSDAAARQVAGMGLARAPLVVPHGVYDIFRLSSPSREAARAHVGGLAAGDRVVLFFGHLEPRKGLLEFLDVARRLRDRPGIKFLVAGSNDLAQHGPAAAALLEEARALPNVVMHDRRIPFEEVEHYFAASDLVALPYREGSTSGVLKLALAFGVPVVASRIGDLPQELPAGGGMLIEPGAGMADELEQAVLSMLGSSGGEAAARAMRDAAHDKSWPVIAGAYAAFLAS